MGVGTATLLGAGGVSATQPDQADFDVEDLLAQSHSLTEEQCLQVEAFLDRTDLAEQSEQVQQLVTALRAACESPSGDETTAPVEDPVDPSIEEPVDPALVDDTTQVSEVPVGAVDTGDRNS